MSDLRVRRNMTEDEVSRALEVLRGEIERFVVLYWKTHKRAVKLRSLGQQFGRRARMLGTTPRDLLAERPEVYLMHMNDEGGTTVMHMGAVEANAGPE